MKKVTTFLSILSTAALLALFGCATTKQTEDLLSAAGFKAVPATTPQQQAQLKQLPAGKVSKVQRNGKEYMIYPDRAHNVLYVGQPAQYDQYQKLRQQKEAAEELTPMQTEAMNQGLFGDW